MLVGYIRVSSVDDRQTVDLQRDALLAAGVDDRHLHQNKEFGGPDGFRFQPLLAVLLHKIVNQLSWQDAGTTASQENAPA